MGFKLYEMDEDITRLDLIGDFDAQDALEYPNHLAPFIEKARLTGKKLHVYVDTAKFGKLSVEGRRVLSAANQSEHQGKIAATGVSRVLSMVARFIMVASGKDNIQFFNSEREALEWLRQSE